MKFSVFRMFQLLLFGFAATGCNAFNRPPPTALPTIILDSRSTTPGSTGPSIGSNSVTASGKVAPSKEAELVFAIGGKLEMVNVSVGDVVESGQILATLEGQEDLQAAVSKAQYELVQAQQALDVLVKEAETSRVKAMQDIITYERSVRDARYALDNFTVPSNQANLDTVDAINQMKLRLDKARAAFDPYKYRPSSDPTREDLKEALDEAQADYNTAVKRLQYEYDLVVAETQLSRAQLDYATYKAGPDPDKTQLAEARLANAQTQLAAARAALENLQLTAPFAGTVSRVQSHTGEWVIPGQVLLVLADLEHLRVETTDLSERDIPRVEIGQVVTVYIEALGATVKGKVAEIAPLADVLGGDVVYKTTIELENYPEELRAGMSVQVMFGEQS